MSYAIGTRVRFHPAMPDVLSYWRNMGFDSGRICSLADPASRLRISTGNPYERRVGYSRAVRVGDFISVGGTTAINAEGVIASPNDAYGQTVHALTTIEWALEQAGASLDDVVNYRVYLTSRADIPAVSRALSETFKSIRPTNTLVIVAGLADPAMLVEIEAQAIAGTGSPTADQTPG